MAKPRKMSITRGTSYAFAALLLLYGIHMAFYSQAIGSMKHLTRTIYNHPLVVSNASQRANTNIVKIHRNMKDVVLFDDPAVTAAAISEVDRLEQDTLIQLQMVEENILGERGRQVADEAMLLFRQWAPIRKSVINYVQEDQRTQAALITKSQGAEHVDKLEAKMVELNSYARRKATGFLQSTEKVEADIQKWSVALFISWIILSSLVIFYTVKRSRLLEREVNEQHEKLKVTIHSIGDGVIVTDTAGLVTIMNPVAEELTGWREEDAIGRDIQAVFHIIHETTRVPCESIIDKVIASNGIVGLANHTSLVAKDGSERAIADSGAPIRDEQQAITGVVLVFRDQTRERQHQEQLEESERKYRLISDNSLDVIWTINLDFTFTFVSRAIVDLTGYREDEWLGSRLSDHCDTDNFMMMERIVETELAKGVDADGFLFEAEILKKNGDAVPVEIRGRVIYDESGQAICLQGATRDITERRKALEQRQEAELKRQELEKQLQQAQKMESVGRLAGGIAHDFNNMLNVILGFGQLAQEQVSAEDPLGEDLSEIVNAAQRAAGITKQLLAFARQQTVSPKIIDLNNTIEGLLKMLRRLIGEDIDLAWVPDEALWAVKIDPGQIDQIITNLCVNARDAIEGIGKVTIETANSCFDEEYCQDHPDFLPGEYVMIAISDSGRGMDPATLENIFDPFFTTKGAGEGTGLGLAMVYGIVKQNQGFINVCSEKGEGTVIKVYLPRFAEKITYVRKHDHGAVSQVNGETILLVEDEIAILKLGTRMLDGLGYNVLEAATPESAIELAEEFEGEIDLLITDVIMPGMNGRDLAAQILSLHDGIKVLYMSGYTANVIAHRGVLDEGLHFMPKPFSRNILARKVRAAIEA